MSNRSDFHAVDYANHPSALLRERGKVKGELIWADVKANKEQRDDEARAWRKRLDGRKFDVATGTRVVKFDSVSITTYVITIRKALDQ